MNTYVKTIFGAAMVLALTACGNPDNKNVPTDIVDQNQTISRDNAQIGAKRWVNERMPSGYRAVAQSDSTISKTCRFGDGWASVDVFDANMRPANEVGLVNADGGPVKLQLKCQTNGAGKGLYGCLSTTEFKTKEYKEEDGTCQNLPSLPKFSSQAN